MGHDPVHGFDVSQSVTRPVLIGGLFTRDEVDKVLFRPHPSKKGQHLSIGQTDKGWHYFEPTSDDPSGFRRYGAYDKFVNRRAQHIASVVDIDFVPGPNGSRVVNSWSPR